MNGRCNGRPLFQHSASSDPTGPALATIKWDQFEVGSESGPMAWVIMGTEVVRFVSFSDVTEPRLATDWKYRPDGKNLTDAPNFRVLLQVLSNGTVSFNGALV